MTDIHTTLATKVASCPFCGSPDVSMSYSATMESAEPVTRFIECDECAACGPPCDVMEDDAAYERAAAAWNTRHTQVAGD